MFSNNYMINCFTDMVHYRTDLVGEIGLNGYAVDLLSTTDYIYSI